MSDEEKSFYCPLCNSHMDILECEEEYRNNTIQILKSNTLYCSFCDFTLKTDKPILIEVEVS